MLPKPFPYPLGIGVDLVERLRVRSLLEEGFKMNQWARHVFSRLEWPYISLAFQNHPNLVNGVELAERRPRLVLPNVWRVSHRLPGEYIPSKNRQLLDHLAGRWAMKEAAIKAHKNRKIFMREISVLPYSENEKLLPGKPQILIDLPRREIWMNSRVASLRGLRNTKANWMEENESQSSGGLTAPLADVPSPDFVNHSNEKIYKRRALVKDQDRQVVEGSISHHGAYAVAVCMAVDEIPNHDKENTQPIFDDGSGEPIHEPQWGDQGFLGSKALDNVETAELELRSMKDIIAADKEGMDSSRSPARN